MGLRNYTKYIDIIYIDIYGFYLLYVYVLSYVFVKYINMYIYTRFFSHIPGRHFVVERGTPTDSNFPRASEHR